MDSLQPASSRTIDWVRLLLVFGYLLLIALMNIAASNEEVSMNLSNPDTLLMFKLMQVAGVIIIFIVPAFLFAYPWRGYQSSAFLGLKVKPSLISMIIAGLAIICALPLINFIAGLNERMDLPDQFSGLEQWMKHSEEKANQLTEAFMEGTRITDLLMNLVVVAFMAALSEEIFFRGLLQNAMQQATRNVHVSVWVSAFIFSAFHMQFYGLVPRTLMGAFLGYAYVFSGSLWVSIFAHFANNGLAVFLTYLIKTGYVRAETETIGATTDELPFLLASLVLTTTFIALMYRKRSIHAVATADGDDKNSEDLPENEEIV